LGDFYHRILVGFLVAIVDLLNPPECLRAGFKNLVNLKILFLAEYKFIKPA